MSGDVTRRAFLGGAGAAVGGIALQPTWSKAGASPPSQNQPSTVHLLGPEPPLARQLIRSVSDDVFERACRSVAGRSFKLIAPPDLSTLTLQVHTGVELDARYASDYPPEFPLAAFRAMTNRWTRGKQLLLQGRVGCDSVYGGVTGVAEEDGCDLAILMGESTRVGFPPLPKGIPWAANYLDERTGLVMRALMTYEIDTDRYLLRYDVLCR